MLIVVLSSDPISDRQRFFDRNGPKIKSFNALQAEHRSAAPFFFYCAPTLREHAVSIHGFIF